MKGIFVADNKLWETLIVGLHTSQKKGKTQRSHEEVNFLRLKRVKFVS